MFILINCMIQICNINHYYVYFMSHKNLCMYVLQIKYFFLKEKNFNSEVTFIYVVVRDSITISNSYVLNLHITWTTTLVSEVFFKKKKKKKRKEILNNWFESLKWPQLSASSLNIFIFYFFLETSLNIYSIWMHLKLLTLWRAVFYLYKKKYTILQNHKCIYNFYNIQFFF